MSLRMFGLWCLVFGHKRAAASRRNLNGSIFGDCSRCGRELYRDPVTTVWRPATDQDRQPRGFSLTEPLAERATKPARKRSGKSARR